MDSVIRHGVQPASSPEQRALAKRRRWLIGGTLGGLLLAAAGAGGYLYYSGKPTQAADHFKAGMSNMTPGHYRAAIAEFDQALQVSPERTDVFLPRAQAYEFLGQFDPALEDYQRALTANPRQPAVYVARGSIYRKHGDFPRALENFSKAVEIQDYTDAYFERAQVYESQGDYAKALADMDRVVLALRDAPHALRARSALRLKAGDKAGAQEDLARAQAFERRGEDQVFK